MNAIARELSWRKVAYRWNFRVAHLPAQFNGLADDLSRLYADPPHLFPSALAQCRQCAAPSQAVIWQAWVTSNPAQFKPAIRKRKSMDP